MSDTTFSLFPHLYYVLAWPLTFEFAAGRKHSLASLEGISQSVDMGPREVGTQVQGAIVG